MKNYKNLFWKIPLALVLPFVLGLIIQYTWPVVTWDYNLTIYVFPWLGEKEQQPLFLVFILIQLVSIFLAIISEFEDDKAEPDPQPSKVM